jgi:hypothetical protein
MSTRLLTLTRLTMLKESSNIALIAIHTSSIVQEPLFVVTHAIT